MLPFRNPSLFTGLRARSGRVLLYGPPGSGKTFVAKATAAECGRPLIVVTPSLIMSKYVGDAEKQVRCLFAVAKSIAPCLVFIDEADALLGSRRDGEHDALRRVKTELLTALDGAGSEMVATPPAAAPTDGPSRAFSASPMQPPVATPLTPHPHQTSQHIFVIAATNRPDDLDDAFIRRFPTRVYVPLPAVDQRVTLLATLLASTRHSLGDSDVRRVAAATEGYSMSDLRELLSQAAMAPIRRLGTTAALTATADTIQPMTIADVLNSLATVKPSVRPDSVAAAAQFFG